jgi:hypothetical protein
VFLVAGSKSNALAPHGLVRISNLMAFEWFHPGSRLRLGRFRSPQSPSRLPRDPERTLPSPAGAAAGPENL